ncbi:DDE-type integrase/transposase/recombinase [Arsenicicoccus dermatophilus]|uniref:DDE-type integrase/transposase/recombinase n=1 Tax=Arsenicicoccus dermatophilus TaxID=1076331 RepID=UPI0030C74EC6
MDFIDSMRAKGYAVESVCQVLTSQGCQVAARSYRRWSAATRDDAARARIISSRALDLAYLMNEIHCSAYRFEARAGERGRWVLTPEGLYGRRKMHALLLRAGHDVSYGRVHTAMSALGLAGVRRGKKVRTTIPGKDGHRAGDLLNRDFTADAPNTKWVMDFTYVRTWAGFCYVAFVLDCYSLRIVGWHVASTKTTPLVMTPLRMAVWERERQGHPVAPGQLVSHSDAGSQGGFNWSSQHPEQEGGAGRGDRALEHEDRRCARGGASAVAC